jgi:hypothetical protein
LKAATLALRIPIQIVWLTTYDNDAVVKRKLAELSTRKVQDETTRAWNFFCALYYKAGGTPWRRIRDQREFSATFMGVSFFEGLDGSSLQTSSAQLFDERGEGLILKGGPGLKDKSDRQPFLSAVDAFNLTRTALQSYKKEHGNYPVSSPMLYPATRLGAHDSLTIIRLHQSFAVSAFRFATASVKTGRRHKQGEPRWLSVKRKRAGSSA